MHKVIIQFFGLVTKLLILRKSINKIKIIIIIYTLIHLYDAIITYFHAYLLIYIF